MKKFLAITLMAILVAVDQLIKNWALDVLEPLRQIAVIPGLFNLTYVENRGAAFGILQGKAVILSVVSGAFLLIIICALLMGKFKSNFLLWTISVGLAGGLGNLYDRTVRGFVVDYIDFSALFGFPVFNFADCCVVCATILILLYCIKLDSGIKAHTDEENLNHEAD